MFTPKKTKCIISRTPVTGKGEARTRKVNTVPPANENQVSRDWTTGPQIFQLGDIVEVQVSFIAIPLRGNKWKINTILRSINLFEGRFTQVNIDYTTGYKYYKS